LYVLRVFFRSAQTLDFNFHDGGVAQRAIDAVSEKRVEMGQIRILDDAGRDFRFDGKDVLSEGLIDVDLETESVVLMGVSIHDAGERARRRAGINQPPPFEPPPEPSFEPPPPMPPLSGALGSLLPAGDERRARFSG
jgi:hypothetical protein